MTIHIALWHESFLGFTEEYYSSDILGVYSTEQAALKCIERFLARSKEIDGSDEEIYGHASIRVETLDAVRPFYPSGAWPIQPLTTEIAGEVEQVPLFKTWHRDV